MMASRLRPLRALPSLLSDSPSPYTSAVSKKLTPPFKATQTARSTSSGDTAPQPWPPMGQHPNPRREMHRSLLPKVVYCTTARISCSQEMEHAEVALGRATSQILQ